MFMFKNLILSATFITIALLTGCASVPMESKAQDAARKEFTKPPDDKAGLYVYRNSSFGAALKKNVYIDDVLIGETARLVYFYKEISPGKHKLSTESEFSDNAIEFEAKGGNNYFAQQSIKIGVFVGGASIEMVPEEVGMKGVLECALAVCK